MTNRLGNYKTVWLMGFIEHGIPELVSGGLLKPLGSPTATGSSYFGTVDLQTLRNDTCCPAKASDAIVNH
jgi:hypothetical protein